MNQIMTNYGEKDNPFSDHFRMFLFLKNREIFHNQFGLKLTLFFVIRKI